MKLLNVSLRISVLRPHPFLGNIWLECGTTLIHEYFGVDLGIVWAVIQDELPPLQDEIKKLMDQLTKQSP